MSKPRKPAIWFVTLLGVVIILGAFCWGSVGAQKPWDELRVLLGERLGDLPQGLWAGLVDPPLTASCNQQINYIAYYRNDGPAVSGAVRTITLPAETEIRTIPVSGTLDGLAVVVPLGNVATGQGGSVPVSVIVRPGTPAEAQLVARVEVAAAGGTPFRYSCAPTIVQAPRLQVLISERSAVRRCSDATYTAVVSNTGTLGATQVTVMLDLPAGFLFLDAAPTLPTRRITGATTTLIWENVNLAPGARWETSLQVRVTAVEQTMPGTQVTCTAEAGVSECLLPLRATASVTSVIGFGPCPTFLPFVYSYASTCMDAYEPDDRPGQITGTQIHVMQVNISATDHFSYTHNFFKPADQDWMRFYAYPGITYTVETFDLVNEPPTATVRPRTDTVLQIYEPNDDPSSGYITGTLILESNRASQEEGVYGSSGCFTATTRGWYYVRVYQRNPLDAGCDTGYKVRVSERECAPLPRSR
jgi:uncharacterized repeat protein (TIGR01451 family)